MNATQPPILNNVHKVSVTIIERLQSPITEQIAKQALSAHSRPAQDRDLNDNEISLKLAFVFNTSFRHSDR